MSISGQSKVPGVVNVFNRLRLGKPQGLPNRKPLWPQGDLISPRDLERDADLQEVYRSAKAFEERLIRETKERKKYQLIAISMLVAAATSGVYVLAPVALGGLRAWAIASIPDPVQARQTKSAVTPAPTAVPESPGVALSGAASAPGRLAPVAMDPAMAGVPPPVPGLSVTWATAQDIPYKAPASNTLPLKSTVGPSHPPMPLAATIQKQTTAGQLASAPRPVVVTPLGTSAKVRPAPAPAQETPDQGVTSISAAPTSAIAVPGMSPRFIESPPVIQGFAGSTGVLISFGNGGPVRAYRLNDVLTPGENIIAISPMTGEITTTRRTIRK